MSKLTIVKKARFGTLTLEFYGDIRSSDFYMTRDQIGRALGYDDPKRAIGRLHKRHSERLDPLSRVVKLTTLDGRKREIFLYEAKGVYEICRHSDKPNANAFYDFAYEVIEGLRLGRFKIIAEKQTPDWQRARQLAKETRKDEADVIRRFVEYARSQGSKNADRYYTSVSELANKSAGIENRDFSDSDRLHTLHFIERVIATALSEGMRAEKEYHEIFRNAKNAVKQFVSLVNLQKGA